MLHKLSDIETAANALANQLAAGIKLREAVARMSKLQPQHADFWLEAAETLSRGGRLSAILEGYWPEGITAALRAGEESQTTAAVLRRTVESLRTKAQVKKIYSKLLSPVIAFLAGLGVFLFFMIAVIPKLQANLGGGEANLVFKAASAMSYAFENYGLVIGGGLALVVMGTMNWFRKPENQEIVIGWGDATPLLGDALRSLYFGMWANQVALLDTAGLPIKQQLLLSVKTLPACYQEGVELMASEVEKRGIADSADPDLQEEGDPRKAWPFYIATAFLTGHETGRIDEEMTRCAPILIDEGVAKLTKFIGHADLVAKVSAAVMIGLPMSAYFSQLANSLTAAFS